MFAPVNVTTRSYDPARSGANLAEIVLTQASVRTKGVALQTRLYMDGDARGTEGQPLVLAGVPMADGLQHNIIIACSMSNDVYVWDFDNYELLWARRIANPIRNEEKYDEWNINDHWGILGTPEADVINGMLYCVSMSSPDGSFNNTTHQLHAIRLADGAEPHPPVDLSQASYQPPNGLPLQRFGNVPRKQRCGLASDLGARMQTVYIACGSFIESADTNQGWLIACDVTNGVPSYACAITTAARYSGGGLWMGSQAPTVHPVSGVIGVVTGNGAFDGITDFGECVVGYEYTPKSASEPATLQTVDWFPPFTDTGAGYGAKYQTLVDVSLIPDNAPDAAGATNMDSALDSDLGSGGRLEVTMEMSGYEKDYTIVCGKHGIGYVLDNDGLGSPMPKDFAPNLIQTNVYDLALSINWLTYYNPATPRPSDLSQLPTTYWGRTHHLHSTPVFYKSAIHGPMIFVWGENGNLRAFALNANGSLTYLACSAEVASPQAPVPPGGMPGGMITLSANGQVPGTAMVHACVPAGNANQVITKGRYLIYDAENFATFADGSKQIVVLWDSWNTGIVYSHCKFGQSSVSGGKIVVPTYDGDLLVLA